MTPFNGPGTRGGYTNSDTAPHRRNLVMDAASWVDARVLGAGVSEAHPIPAGALAVNFASNGDFFVQFATLTGTIAVPTVAITDGSAPVLNPGARIIPENAA